MLKSTQTIPTNDNTDTGTLQVSAVRRGTKIPIENVTVSISFTGEPEKTIEELKTDSSGQTETVTLETPPLEYSMSFGQAQPYAEYNLTIRAYDYDETLLITAEIRLTALPDPHFPWEKFSTWVYSSGEEKTRFLEIELVSYEYSDVYKFDEMEEKPW